jgi:competence protein ComEC
LKKSPKSQELVRKPSPVSKISWHYKPGLFFWLGLLMMLAAFVLIVASNFWQKIIGYLILGGGLLFAVSKFRSPWLLLSVILLGGSLHYHQIVQLQPEQPLIIYPDEIEVTDHFMHGLARQDQLQVRIYGKVDAETEHLLKHGAIKLSNWEGEVSKIQPPRNRAQFNYRRYSLSQGIADQVKLRTGQTTVVSWPLAHRLKFKLQQYLSDLPPHLCFFASELLLAKADDEVAIKDNYRQLGVVHLLSLSGLHVSLYCLLVTTIGYRLHFTDEETTIICACLLICGIFLSNWQPGFVRAGISYGIKQVRKFRRWPLANCDILGLTLCLHLCLQPRLFLNVGAQLSYLLAWGLQLTADRSRWQQGLCLNLLIAPVLLANFYGLNLLTCLFNLVIVPYFNCWVMPVTFLGLIPGLTSSCEWLLAASEKIVAKLAAANLGWISFGQLSWWQELVLTGLTLYWLIWLLPIKHKKWQWPWLLYLLCFLSLHFPLHGQVTFIDVGQGDSILLTTPGKRQAYLIDTGGRLNFGSSKPRPAQLLQTTLPYLKAQGITKLDGVFLSHQDADHIGDLRALLKKMPVDHLYFAAGLDKNPHFQRKLAGLKIKTQLHPLLVGDCLQLSPQLQIKVLWPQKPGPGSNEDSLCLLAQFPQASWLFTGDLDREHEKILVKAGVQADYLKLGHHGSKTASDPEFLKAVKPKRVFISAGVNNRYGHPHPETMLTLRKLGLAGDNTAECGMISWTYDLFHRERFSYVLKEPDS